MCGECKYWIYKADRYKDIGITLQSKTGICCNPIVNDMILVIQHEIAIPEPSKIHTDAKFGCDYQE